MAKDILNDFDARMKIEENVKDYCLTIVNDHPGGMGVRVTAGQGLAITSSEKSVAILSIADREHDNKFVVKSNGAVVSFHSHQIGNVFITKNSITSVNGTDQPVEFNSPIMLDNYAKKDLPMLPTNKAGSVLTLEDENFKPVYYDGHSWRYFSNDEVAKR